MHRSQGTSGGREAGRTEGGRTEAGLDTGLAAGWGYLGERLLTVLNDYIEGFVFVGDLFFAVCL